MILGKQKLYAIVRSTFYSDKEWTEWMKINEQEYLQTDCSIGQRPVQHRTILSSLFENTDGNVGLTRKKRVYLRQANEHEIDLMRKYVLGIEND